jgi:hypothetical protein
MRKFCFSALNSTSMCQCSLLHRRHCGRRQIQMIGQKKSVPAACPRPSSAAGVGRGPSLTVPVFPHHDLIGAHACADGRPALQHKVGRVVLQPGDEVHTFLGQLLKPAIVGFAAVQHQHRAALQSQPAANWISRTLPSVITA